MPIVYITDIYSVLKKIGIEHYNPDSAGYYTDVV